MTEKMKPCRDCGKATKNRVQNPDFGDWFALCESCEDKRGALGEVVLR